MVQTSDDTIAVRVEPVGEQEAQRIRTAVASVAGLVAGTASTIVTAGPVAILLDRRFPNQIIRNGR